MIKAKADAEVKVQETERQKNEAITEALKEKEEALGKADQVRKDMQKVVSELDAEKEEARKFKESSSEQAKEL